MRDGPLAGERFEVDGELVLGRTNADITIEDPLISRRHAVVRAVDAALEIEDLGSLNGTVVNSEKLEAPRRLQPGDVIMVGATTIEVEGDPSASSRTVLAATPPAAVQAAAPAEPTELVSPLSPSLEEAPEPEPPAPVEPEPVGPVEPGRPAAVEPEPLAPVEPGRPAAVEPEPLAPVEPERPAAVEPEPPAAVEPEPTPAAEPTPTPAPEPKQPEPVEPPVLAEPRPGEGDELRPVTALFADIVGSTSLGERLSADEVKVVIGECVTRMCHAVEQFGGDVQSHMGDGIAAFFGVPAAHEDDPERAARAAIRILDVVGDYAREVEAAWGISDFSARVGINTGEVAVGMVGAADPRAVTLGDTANVAARLQSAAEPGKAVVGEATAKSVLHRFELEPLGEVKVKGRIQPVGAWRLVGLQASTTTYPLSPLVGRLDEMQRLHSILDELVAGRGQLLMLVGDAGIGKTRLLAELRALATGRVTWLEGQCLSYGTELLYGPFIEMLRKWIGAEEGEAELALRTKLRAKLGLLPAAQLADVFPYLARLLSVKLDREDEERQRNLTPEELAAEIRRAYSTWVSALASQGPVVVAIEDLHWADRSTRALAEDLLELADIAPILIIAVSRIDPESEGWKLRVRGLTDFPHRAVELTLGPLDDEAASQLLASRPQSESLDESELAQIVMGAEGNPLYLEELLNAFVEGKGARRSRTWAPTYTSARLTPTLESLLLARIDRLPPETRRLAQVAAIIGRSFPQRVLEHVAETENLEAELALLLRADIIRELRRYPEPEYVFRHGLLRQASLSALPAARRRELYSAVAAAFETLFASSLDDYLEVLANYYGRSLDLGKAIGYLERAGDRAVGLDAAPQAFELWKRALKIADKLEDEDAKKRIEERMAALDLPEE
jgi:class 3 adenylate cyclase